MSMSKRRSYKLPPPPPLFSSLLQLCSEATWLERYRAADEESHTVTFELYLSMRDIANLTEHVKDET